MKNPFAKTRDIEKPYAVFKSAWMPGWEWRVLKTYKLVKNEKGDPYARWFCAVKSPMTYGSWEYGDTYVKDIVQVASATIDTCDDEWREHYVEYH